MLPSQGEQVSIVLPGGGAAFAGVLACDKEH